MIVYGIRIARTVVRIAWFGATVSVLALAAIPHLMPYVGREMYVVRGASMRPAIPLGAVVVVGHVDPATIAVGDVITFRAPNETVVTHRVVGVGPAPEITFQTKGDASSATDPIVVPAHSLIGRVEVFVPVVGVIVALLASTLGGVAALGLIGGLLLAMTLMDELLAAARKGSERRSVRPEPAH